MIDNIIFAGGIHGAGKGTICKELSQSFKFNHLSASEVLKCGMSSFVGTISTKFVIEEHL
ncbi:MAG: AAA family ATPase [Algibacter sp.]|uniref:AAA family ATPase n=1 Tax=Algibacter sp. TaxID=1872428 RepID=UPI00260D024B|nr:AAA family ATPase [Algibacter sp.]MDG1730294.1 AAA family ATPase [Algibacter sp.]MDG2178922.1 AAA family ATPase [Algibacter sp.]